MTDPELVEKRLAFLETCVSELKRLGRPAELESDLREQRFVLYTLQVAIQAALDAASHIVSDERLGEPKTNAELFAQLSRASILPAELADSLARMAGFRNVLVHAYVDVDMSIVKQVLSHHLGDLLEYAARVRDFLNKAT